MSSRIKALLPLAVAVAVLTFIWLEVSLNFTFHWMTDGDLGIGLSLPSDFHLVPPAAFISWAVFFAAGANRRAFAASAVAVTIGAAAALVLMVVTPWVADLPDFWGIAAVTAVIALIAVLACTPTFSARCSSEQLDAIISIAAFSLGKRPRHPVPHPLNELRPGAHLIAECGAAAGNLAAVNAAIVQVTGAPTGRHLGVPRRQTDRSRLSAAGFEV